MMHISYERTGGFAGMHITLSLDSTSLPAADVDNLQKLIQEADFFNLPDDQSAHSHPDGFQYTINIQSESHHHTLHLTDGSIPDKLQPLLSDLNGRARSQGKPS